MNGGANASSLAWMSAGKEEMYSSMVLGESAVMVELFTT
jgi:hypothetical protein